MRQCHAKTPARQRTANSKSSKHPTQGEPSSGRCCHRCSRPWTWTWTWSPSTNQSQRPERNGEGQHLAINRHFTTSSITQPNKRNKPWTWTSTWTSTWTWTWTAKTNRRRMKLKAGGVIVGSDLNVSHPKKSIPWTCSSTWSPWTCPSTWSPSTCPSIPWTTSRGNEKGAGGDHPHHTPPITTAFDRQHSRDGYHAPCPWTWSPLTCPSSPWTCPWRPEMQKSMYRLKKEPKGNGAYQPTDSNKKKSVTSNPILPWPCPSIPLPLPCPVWGCVGG